MATAGKWVSLRPKLDRRTIVALKTMGKKRMTPVQAAAISPLMENKDVVVEAQTGSGKTLSFLVPMLEMLLKTDMMDREARRGIVALIIEPTRELAQQVHKVAQELFANVDVESVPVPALLTGGTNGKRAKGGVEAVIGQLEKEGADFRVCIATPGILQSALSKKLLSGRQLEMLVLDEADRLLDLGFEVTLSSIFDNLRKQRRTGLYSATQTKHVRELAKAGLRDPVRVRVQVCHAGNGEAASTPVSLKSFFHICTHEDRLPYLLELIRSRAEEKFIVYFLTCAEVDYFRRLDLGSLLGDRAVHAISGKVWQKKRTRIMEEFRASPNGVLLCTDVAARGLDVPDVDVVVQYDAPQDPKAYIHRAGRTARLGRKGQALLYLSPHEEPYVDFLRDRRIDVAPLEAPFESAALSRWKEELRARARKLMLEDRANLEAGELAYLSYVRAYKEHHCSYILRFESLDAGSVARSLHLIRLPRISEFKQFRRRIEFEEDTSVDYWAIPFRDKKLEQERLERQKNIQAAKRHREAETRQNKRPRKQKQLRLEGHSFDRAELDELASDASLVRKLRKGKMSKFDLEEAGL